MSVGKIQVPEKNMVLRIGIVCLSKTHCMRGKAKCKE